VLSSHLSVDLRRFGPLAEEMLELEKVRVAKVVLVTGLEIPPSQLDDGQLTYPQYDWPLLPAIPLALDDQGPGSVAYSDNL
jgi:hypothetical protein